jgi:uncharacterized protein YciI
MSLGQRSALLVLIAVVVTAPLAAGAETKADMGTVFLVLLEKGPAWSAAETPESKAIQEAHMANIRAMWQAGKLILAGPMGDDGDLRGIFLLQAAGLEEARSLAASDPAVKAGRLRAEVHPWWVERRALPEAGKFCRSIDPP